MYLKIHICKVTFLQFELKSLIEILPFSNREVGQLKITRHLKQTLPIPNVNAKQREQIFDFIDLWRKAYKKVDVHSHGCLINQHLGVYVMSTFGE